LRINEFYKPGTTCRQVQRTCRQDFRGSCPKAALCRRELTD
jgi:hypothetical protein